MDKGTVLIVDDSQLELAMIKGALENEGFECIAIHNTDGVLAFAKECDPIFIILDLYMPDKSGLELCRELKLDPQTRDIPVIFLTASDEIDHVISAIHLGCIDYFQKPVDMAKFAETLKSRNVLSDLHRIFTDMRQDLTALSEKY